MLDTIYWVFENHLLISMLCIVTFILLHFMRRYVVHRFSIHRPTDINLCALRPVVLKTAKRACSHFRDVADRYQGLIQKRLGIELQGPDPDVRVSTTDVGINVMTVSLFCPVDEAIAIEQIITDKLMAAWYAEVEKQKQAFRGR